MNVNASDSVPVLKHTAGCVEVLSRTTELWAKSENKKVTFEGILRTTSDDPSD